MNTQRKFTLGFVGVIAVLLIGCGAGKNHGTTIYYQIEHAEQTLFCKSLQYKNLGMLAEGCGDGMKHLLGGDKVSWKKIRVSLLDTSTQAVVHKTIEELRNPALTFVDLGASIIDIPALLAPTQSVGNVNININQRPE